MSDDDTVGPVRRKNERIRDDAMAVEVVRLLGEIAKRVKHEPAVRPNPAGMVRLAGTDRASYVWFLKCPPDTRPGLDGQPMTTCNHGIGVDREHLGQWLIRAWAHGRPEVFRVEIHTGRVTLELLERAAEMVGIPLAPKEDARTWVHGSRLGREHRSVRQHLIEDHGHEPAYVHGLSEGGVHGLHDGEHRTTWAYAADLTHERCKGRTEVVNGEKRVSSWHLVSTRTGTCPVCLEASRATQEHSMSDPEGA